MVKNRNINIFIPNNEKICENCKYLLCLILYECPYCNKSNQWRPNFRTNQKWKKRSRYKQLNFSDWNYLMGGV